MQIIDSQDRYMKNKAWRRTHWNNIWVGQKAQIYIKSQNKIAFNIKYAFASLFKLRNSLNSTLKPKI